MMVLKMKHFALFIIAVLCCNSAFAGVISVAVKTIPDAVTVAARKSGKALSPAMRNAAELAVEKAVANYGDDVLKTVAHGGLETLDAGTKYGDDFWRLCHNATPDAVRSLALHADDLMPIAKRVGPDFMTLEGKVPGLGSKIVQTFGDDAVKGLSKAPADDIAKLIGYAEKADNPQTVSLLYQTYRKDNGKFLRHLNWKTIMAGGLSAAAITAAYNTSAGVKNGIETVAAKSPMGFWIVFCILGIILLLPLILKLYKYLCK